MNLPSKKILFYILAFLIFTPIFYSLGLFVGMKFVHDETLNIPLIIHSPRTNNAPTFTEEKIATFSGIVREQVIKDLPGQVGPTRGTHQLEENDGRLIVFLKSNSIDLSFVEGSWVTVEGVIEKIPGFTVDLMEVEKIRFK